MGRTNRPSSLRTLCAVVVAAGTLFTTTTLALPATTSPSLSTSDLSSHRGTPHSPLKLIRTKTKTRATTTKSSLTGGPLFPPLPVILWHGLGDNYAADGIASVIELIQEVNPETYVYAIRLDENGDSDRRASFFGNVTEQLEQVCEDIAKDPVLSQAKQIDALGFSQGGVFLRGYVERCNNPPVRSLVTFGSPHNGIEGYAGCKSGDWLCKGAMALLRSNTWSAFVQGRLVPAQYYRNLDDTTGLPSEEYLSYSNFLADINNERELKNKSYASNLSSLKRFVMYEFSNDTTVIPKESESFADVNLTSSAVTLLRERKLYKEDWIGLKELDNRGGLIFQSAPGAHMNLPDEILEGAFKKYFGRADLFVNSDSDQEVVEDEDGEDHEEEKLEF